MNKISYEDRCKVYLDALIAYGDRVQMTKAVEEMGECIQAICKVMIGGQDFDHLAEEIADATIVLEQMRLMFNINDRVCQYMDAKVARLDADLKKRAIGDRPYNEITGR
jgi:NTP pyrophosphatase (non-canonical NTP hydrolase)